VRTSGKACGTVLIEQLIICWLVVMLMVYGAIAWLWIGVDLIRRKK
jgi:hypothetical protein